ncbi:hypothetical protein GCM10017687_53950 [Streptomyces echinatus]
MDRPGRVEGGQRPAEAVGEHPQSRFGQRAVPVHRLPERQSGGELGRQPRNRRVGVGIHDRYEEGAGQRPCRIDRGPEPVPEPRVRGEFGPHDRDRDE